MTYSRLTIELGHPGWFPRRVDDQEIHTEPDEPDADREGRHCEFLENGNDHEGDGDSQEEVDALERDPDGVGVDRNPLVAYHQQSDQGEDPLGPEAKHHVTNEGIEVADERDTDGQAGLGEDGHSRRQRLLVHTGETGREMAFSGSRVHVATIGEEVAVEGTDKEDSD